MPANDIEEQASIWLAREIRELTADERDALEVWLAVSSLHKVSYLRLKAAWQRAGRLAALKRPPMRPAHPRTSPWSRLRIPAFAAIALVLLYGGRTYLTPSQPNGQTYATDLGQMQTYRLADGTRMELNTNTRVHADVTATKQRIVTLESGEAYFDVAHNDQHPFMVYAANRRITDLGTKFSVFLNGDNVRVLIRQGRVRVDMQPGSAGPGPIVTEAGHMVIAQGQETLVLVKPDREIANDLSWRSGMLVFDQRPLAEVAEEFNRYNAKHIVVEGSARKIHIGGSFKADNVDVFVLLLHQGFGLSVNDQGDRIVVTR
jgi:transmembrane sensor